MNENLTLASQKNTWLCVKSQYLRKWTYVIQEEIVSHKV